MQSKIILQLTVLHSLPLIAAAQNNTNTLQAQTTNGLSIIGYYCLAVYGLSILLGCAYMISEDKKSFLKGLKSAVAKVASSLSNCLRRRPKMHSDDLLEELLVQDNEPADPVPMFDFGNQGAGEFADYRLDPVFSGPQQVLHAYQPPAPNYTPYIEDDADRFMDAVDTGMWPLSRSQVLRTSGNAS